MTDTVVTLNERHARKMARMNQAFIEIDIVSRTRCCPTLGPSLTLRPSCWRVPGNKGIVLS